MQRRLSEGILFDYLFNILNKVKLPQKICMFSDIFALYQKVKLFNTEKLETEQLWDIKDPHISVEEVIKSTNSFIGKKLNKQIKWRACFLSVFFLTLVSDRYYFAKVNSALEKWLKKSGFC